MANIEPPGSPIRRLQNIFGYPKPPDISRKITAYVACRKQKIKCHMNEFQPPCTRCKEKGLHYTVNRSLQMLLENDKIEKLGQPLQARSWVGGKLSDLDPNPAALPGHYLIPANPRQKKVPTDIISRGVISNENAQNNLYCNIGWVREVSPLLAMAICAVGALHLSSSDYEALYREFVTLSAPLKFSRRNTVDDVRVLCIGAFWLSDLSWPLVGLAGRIATGLQLHKSFCKALRGDRNHYSPTRLYLLVYMPVPPMTRKGEAVGYARMFLDCIHATEDDARLVSQVLRWSNCTKVYDSFGPDVDRPHSNTDIPHVRRLVIALDNLRVEWADKVQPKSPDVALELEEIANLDVLSAVSILRAVVSDTEFLSYHSDLPTYLHIMIAFAVETQRLMTSLVTVLKGFRAPMNPHHLFVGLMKEIDDLLQRRSRMASCVAIATPTTSLQQKPQHAIFGHNTPHEELDSTTDGNFDLYLMSELDLLTSQGQDAVM
ncbi:hypothetical protein BDV23DRAFT_193237 [Aspergillus alliaceus]|uniref:Zn(2)-C6 fungal-type domain-containing protein n=1 Tax=Petromyces alliaceus TaxID=209559 RepID=A0A5N7CC40_PETAA|nr:hypothetical protein BDV23DRAFT_193237 [Aspergillus alliaceus]